MKVQIIGKGKRTLPAQFDERVRPDLIKRAVISLRTKRRQPYGSKPEAGMRHSSRISKRRRDWRGSYGMGISRVPRKVMIRRGSRFNWTGATIPSTVGGRRAHPPKAERNWEEKINKKERQKSIRSAIAATVLPEHVEKRHKLPKDYPFILSSEIEDITKTSEIMKIMTDLGLEEELERVKQKKIRSGKGKMRGRKYSKKKGPLVVVSEECPLVKAARNIEGVDVVPVRELNAELLAPGTVPGRLTLWTEKAIDVLKEEELFL